MKIYLDACCLNRPFDDQRQERIRIETEAVMIILARLLRREWVWLGSQAMEIEIDLAPDAEQRLRLRQIASHAAQVIVLGEKEWQRAVELEKFGFSGFDAVHLACAESGGADIFLSTDDRLLRRARRLAKKLSVKAANPLDWLKENL